MIKLTFFENIYYWIWRYMPKIKNSIYPAMDASAVLTLMKVLNIFLFLCLTDQVLNSILFSSMSAIFNILYITGTCFVIFLILDKYHVKKYDNRCDIIVEKMRSLDHKKRGSKQIIFVSYVTATVFSTILSLYLLESITYNR